MMFPIKNDLEIKSIPWAVLKPHELQALRNHAQGLDRLASKGGVTPCEAVAIIEGRPWHRMPFGEARDTLKGYVRKAKGEMPTDIKHDPIREALERGLLSLRALRGRAEAVDPKAALRIERALSRAEGE